MSEVVDLCDSDEELAPLADRLRAREEPTASHAQGQGVKHAAQPTGTHLAAAALDAAVRSPLLAVHNHSGNPAHDEAKAGSASLPAPCVVAVDEVDELQAVAVAVRQRMQARRARKAAREVSAPGASQAADAQGSQPARVQYHQQEQRMQSQELDGRGSSPAASPRHQPPLQRQQRQAAPAAELHGWPAQLSEAADEEEEWHPPDTRQGASPRRQAAGAARRRTSRVAEDGRPAGTKARRPKRTAEEIARDKAVKEQEKMDKSALRAANAKKSALQQVKLLVDSALMSSGAGGTSLGVKLLAHLDEANGRVAQAAAEKRVRYEVAPLDLAPYRTLRWKRLTLLEGGGGAAVAAAAAPGSQSLPASQASGAACSQLCERWELEPHVMACFQASEFVAAVQRDRLEGLLSLLERRAAGQRAYLLVVGLDAHLLKTDRDAYKQDSRQLQAAPCAGAVPSGGQAVRRAIKGDVEEFLVRLAVRCPGLGVRLAVDEAQAADYVRLVTAAIADEAHKDSDASVFLRAHCKANSQVITNLLTNHQLPQHQEEVVKCLSAIPSVKPAIAHVLVSRYGTLGGLMDMLLDPARSDAEKEAAIAGEKRVGTAKSMRVGPTAARQLLGLLRSDDPGVRVRPDAGEAS